MRNNGYNARTWGQRRTKPAPSAPYIPTDASAAYFGDKPQRRLALAAALQRLRDANAAADRIAANGQSLRARLMREDAYRAFESVASIGADLRKLDPATILRFEGLESYIPAKLAA